MGGAHEYRKLRARIARISGYYARHFPDILKRSGEHPMEDYLLLKAALVTDSDRVLSFG
jgi:hypothetical protein